MKNLKKALQAFALTMLCWFPVQSLWAQGLGSIAIESAGGLPTSGTYESYAETIIIPSGNYVVDFTWQIYGKYVWIASDATFTGTGKLQIFNPGDHSGGSGTFTTTYIDGNNAAIGLNVELLNQQNIELADMVGSSAGQDPASDLPGNASLNVLGNFTFGVDLGDVILGSTYTDPLAENITVGNTTATITDLVLGDTSALIGYQPNRMVVTSNSIQGHVVKSFCSAAGSFIFPVGIAEQDYTPAQVSVSNAGNTVHVSVQNYTASTSQESGQDGMNRTWNIYETGCGSAPVGGPADVTLQHNTATDQGAFNENSYFITQWSSAAPNASGDLATSLTAWQSNTSGAGAAGNLSTTGTVSNSSVRSRTYTGIATSATAATAYFSKSSNPVQTLPVKLVSFSAKAADCKAVLNWETAEEKDLDRFVIERSADGQSFSALGAVNARNAGGGSYSVAYPQDNGSAYYRLKMEDKDGSYVYSATTMLHTSCGDKPQLQLWPNPAGENITISGLQAGAQVLVYNYAGQLVYTTKTTGTVMKIDIGEIPTGLYQVRVQDASGSSTMLSFAKL